VIFRERDGTGYVTGTLFSKGATLVTTPVSWLYFLFISCISLFCAGGRGGVA